jgi:hypothetical protein
MRLILSVIAGIGLGAFNLIAGLVLGCFVTYELMQPFLLDRVNYQTIYFTPQNATLHLAATRWGLTGDHEEVRICDRPIEFDTEAGCLVFSSSELFYRKEGEDRLAIYVAASAVYRGQETRLGTIDVLVHELKTAEQYAKANSLYERREVSRIYAP